MDDAYILEQRDEMMDQIDNGLISNGNYSGSVSKKLLLTSGSNHVILLYTAKWSDGNNRGDAHITFTLQDITDVLIQM